VTAAVLPFPSCKITGFVQNCVTFRTVLPSLLPNLLTTNKSPFLFLELVEADGMANTSEWSLLSLFKGQVLTCDKTLAKHQVLAKQDMEYIYIVK
jgi:hypothetical protein